MKKQLLIPIIAAGIVIAGVMGVAAVTAQEESSSPPIVQRIAERFGLNQEEVESVFNEMHEERMQQHKQALEEHFDQAVSDGVITDAQKQALLEKQEELRKERDQHREEMQTWMEEQGIDPEKLAPYGGFGHHGMHMKWSAQ